jgi:hypothetical protein
MLLCLRDRAALFFALVVGAIVIFASFTAQSANTLIKPNQFTTEFSSVGGWPTFTSFVKVGAYAAGVGTFILTSAQ